MARIRTIKPDYWTDDRVGECSPTARLLFIAMWNFADDEGSIDRSAKQLKAQAFPYDQLDCERLVQELLKAGLLIEYEADGKKYLHIKGFGVHQKIEKKARARFPLYKESLRTPRGVGEESGSSAVSSLGMEGNGRDLKKKSPNRPATPARSRHVPKEFEVTEAMKSWAAENCPDTDVERETANFRDHEFKDPHSDWSGAWRKWMRRAPEFKPRNGSHLAEPELKWRPPPDDDDASERL